jgi:hypothetical protein
VTMWTVGLHAQYHRRFHQIVRLLDCQPSATHLRASSSWPCSK